MVDAAAPAMAHVVKDGPKLVGIDLKTNQVVKTIPFDTSTALQASYINDVRISPDGKTAYLTDSGAEGALIVVDLDSGSAKRVLIRPPLDHARQERDHQTTASRYAGPTAAASSSRPTASRSRPTARRCTGRRSRARPSTASRPMRSPVGPRPHSCPRC